MTNPRTITTRDETYSGYDSFVTKQGGSELSLDQTDENFLGLLERIYDLMPVGVGLPYFSSIVPDGWLLCDGTFIGSSGSLADHKDNRLIRLFKLLWNQCLLTSTTSPLVAYDGTSPGVAIDFTTTTVTADQAWAGNYRIALPDTRGYNIAHADNTLSSTLLNTKLYAKTGQKSVSYAPSLTNTLAVGAGGSHNHTASLTINADGAHSHATTVAISTNGSHNHAVSSPPHQHGLQIPVGRFGSDAGSGPYVLLQPSQPVDTSGLLPPETSPPVNVITDANSDAATTSTAGSHTHTATPTNPSAGTHDHGGAAAGVTSTVGTHTHALTGSVSGSAASIATVAPYFGLYMIIKFSYGQ